MSKDKTSDGQKAKSKSKSTSTLLSGPKIVSAVLIIDAFAQCLAAKQAKMYGAYWCPHCADQKEMFESSFQYVAYVECGVPGSRDEAQVCKDAGIKHFPTWQFADGESREGTQPLQSLGA